MGIDVQTNVTKKNISDITNIINKNTSYVSQVDTQTCTDINIGQVVIGGREACFVGPTNSTTQPVSISGTTITVNQTGQTNCKMDADLYVDSIDQNINQLKSDLNQFADTSFASKTGWLAAALTVQTNISDLKSTIKTNIDNISKNDIKQTCDQTASTYNQGTILLCADIEDSSITLNQNGLVTSTNQCSTTAILKAIFNNAALIEVAQKTDDKFKSQESGIGSLFGWLIILAVIIAVVVIIGIIIYAFSGSGSDDKSKQAKQEQQMAMFQALEKKGAAKPSSAAEHPDIL